jgi:hypothetical protein
MQQQADFPTQERSRLIDHFKRAYQIIVGLAITLACTKLFPNDIPNIPSDVSFWLFCTFFITVVPIFHGGDRSLDIKYLRAPPIGFWRRAAYVWDVYMLLITAILFVKIAQAIPGPTILGNGSASPTTPDLFYTWMAYMLFIDVGILIFDGAKNRLLRTEGEAELSAYIKWIVLNLGLAIICLMAKSPPEFLSYFSANGISIVVFGFAFLRTVLDYVFGKEFLFP